MPDDRRRSRSTEAFFGRRRGKALKPRQAELLDRYLPEWRIDLASPPPAALRNVFDHAPTRIVLEIGFGGGEHLLHRALSDPHGGFIGVEPFVNSMAKFVAAAADEGLTNVRLHDDDATQLLDWLPDASLDGVDLLYPDPWPKMRHWKRRFVNAANLDRFARVMKPGAVFRFASDIDTYVNWTLRHIEIHPAFEWTARNAADWREPYDGWPGTRYEAKALREGRTPAYLTFVRR
ncbi:tRNA (guanine(46)-N(7))-methyltransferase TrmB [Oricola cellulosilytica]|uniref:tRNA (guanine-N(7)-)-methyltransferase n=1 Tax=Oricola cellulosilytica TaxID=1429082 RepID=A0A4R0PIM0_9HYPH|nr:tRNA (guanine(46)-N(7))-methyltransferase TrmB [Oricola cellulosilytica]TCD16340.1 tRNA (guanosine(46)-N7)-methyltransferase TrmB [Oricola cellulosilytica]